MFFQTSVHSACQILSNSKKGILNVQGQNTFINLSYLHLQLLGFFSPFSCAEGVAYDGIVSVIHH